MHHDRKLVTSLREGMGTDPDYITWLKLYLTSVGIVIFCLVKLVYPHPCLYFLSQFLFLYHCVIGSLLFRHGILVFAKDP